MLRHSSVHGIVLRVSRNSVARTRLNFVAAQMHPCCLRGSGVAQRAEPMRVVSHLPYQPFALSICCGTSSPTSSRRRARTSSGTPGLRTLAQSGFHCQ